MYCSNCGTQLPDGAKFCTECGKQIPTHITVNAKVQNESIKSDSPVTKKQSKKKNKVLSFIIDVIVALVILYVGISVLGMLEMEIYTYSTYRVQGDRNSHIVEESKDFQDENFIDSYLYIENNNYEIYNPNTGRGFSFNEKSFGDTFLNDENASGEIQKENGFVYLKFMFEEDTEVMFIFKKASFFERIKYLFS